MVKVAFTDSTEMGKTIMSVAADTIKRVTLELGGKSANVIFSNADLGKAAASAPFAVFENAGQGCCARSRILVENEVYDEFLSLLGEAVNDLQLGDSLSEDTQIGLLISATHRERVASFAPESAPATIRVSVPHGATDSPRRCSRPWTYRTGRPRKRCSAPSPSSYTSVLVSTPFGGFKKSGVGREIRPRAMEHYSKLNSVYFTTEED